jgi:hypothetical protein
MPLDPDGLYSEVAQPRRFAHTSLDDRDEMFSDNQRFCVPSIHNQLFQRAFESIKNIGITTVIDWHLPPTRRHAPIGEYNHAQPHLTQTLPKVNTSDICPRSRTHGAQK